MIPSLLQIPSAVSDSKLHSVLPNNGKGDFQFERSTGATRINKDGLIEEVGYFSSELVQNGNFSELGSELIVNGDFSNGLTGFSTENVELAEGGVRIQSDGSSGSFIAQSGILTSGKTYKLVFEVKGVQQSGSLRVGFSSVGSVSISDIGTQTLYFVAGGTQFELVRNSAINVIIDNVSVKQVDPNDRWDAEFYGTDVTITDTLNLVDNGNSGGAGVFQSATIENGKTYKIKFDITASTGSSIVALMFCDNRSGSNQGVVSNYFSAVGSYDLRLTANKDNLGFRFRFARSAGKTASIDNVSIVKVQGDRPRLSYDITNGVVEDKPHLLLEPSSTNRIKFSEDFSKWNDLSSNNVEYVADLVNPDGSVGGYKVKGDGIFVTDGSGMSGAVTSTSGRSIYARSVSGTGNVQLLSHNTNTNNVFTVNETWQRFELNSSPQIGGNFYVDLRGASSTLSEVYVFAAQSESIDIVTSYIPTAGTTITRAAETCNNSKPSVNSTEGVLYAEIAALSNDLTNRRITLSDGSNNNRVVIGYNTASQQIFYFIIVGGSNIASGTSVRSDVTNFDKVAVKFKNNDFAFYIDGSLISTDTSGTIFSANTLNSLQFEQGAGNALFFYGKVKGLAVYNEALTDAQLIELTS